MTRRLLLACIGIGWAIAAKLPTALTASARHGETEQCILFHDSPTAHVDIHVSGEQIYALVNGVDRFNIAKIAWADGIYEKEVYVVVHVREDDAGIASLNQRLAELNTIPEDFKGWELPRT